VLSGIPCRPRYIARRAPIAQLAEAADLKSVQCRFESDWGHCSAQVSRYQLAENDLKSG
jgi:hypothetical protein